MRPPRGPVTSVMATMASLVLLAAACGDGGGASEGDPDDTGTAAAPPAPPVPPPPTALPDAPSIDGMWSEERMAEDLRLITRHEVAIDLASVVGVRELYEYVADHSWPDGYTAAALVRCAFDDPAPSFAQLEDAGLTFGLRLSDLEPRPDWRFPPTGELLADLGMRVYRSTRVELYRVDQEPAWERVATGHVAITPDGRVVSFPICTEFLPGGERAVPPARDAGAPGGGGYVGRPAARLELTHALWDLSPMASMMVCKTYLEAGLEGTHAMFLADGWDLTPEELRAGFTSHCSGYWEDMAEPTAPRT